MDNKKDNTSSTSRDTLVPSTVGAVLFLVLLGFLSYLGYRLGELEERIDDRLAYQPPEATTPEKSDDLAASAARHTHAIYVPVYSHIYAKGGTPVLLETTLSIRNTDPERNVVVTSIKYYDTKGNMIEEYLDGNLELSSLESTEVLVVKQDIRGGSGANFIVTWRADAPVHLPMVQAVMVGGEGDRKISFLSSGQPLLSRTDPKQQK